jgi:transposase
MQAPLFVRPLTEEERQVLAAGLRSADAFTLRRCLIVLASARGERVPAIARFLGCSEQTVRNAIRAFEARDVAALTEGSSRPITVYAAFNDAGAEWLHALLHRSPRDFGHPTSVWTLDLAAATAFAEGITATRVSAETVRVTLARLGIRWRRAKIWITSPDPEYGRKKQRRDRLIALAGTRPDWAIGFEDEVWWSRVRHPTLRAWTDGVPLRLTARTVAEDERDPKALACYGLLVRPGADVPEEVWLRFVDERPISAVTIAFVTWCCERLAAMGITTLVLIWDDASWHVSPEVRRWLRDHNHLVHREGGVRIVPCWLPTKSPWLNPIEPMWAHGKRRVIEPARLLTADELEERVCAAFACPRYEHLTLL